MNAEASKNTNLNKFLTWFTKLYLKSPDKKSNLGRTFGWYWFKNIVGIVVGTVSLVVSIIRCRFDTYKHILF